MIKDINNKAFHLNLNLTNQTQDMPKLLKKSKKEKALERI
jgi:hypothetical protein